MFDHMRNLSLKFLITAIKSINLLQLVGAHLRCIRKKVE